MKTNNHLTKAIKHSLNVLMILLITSAAASADTSEFINERAQETLVDYGTLRTGGVDPDQIINFDSSSRNVIKFINIDSSITHLKINRKKKLGKISNLKILSKKRIRVSTDNNGVRTVSIRLRTKDKSSLHNLSIGFFGRTNRRFRKIDQETINISIAGFEECSNKFKPVCGMQKVNQICNNSICLPVLGKELKTFRNFCKMEEEGFEIFKNGKCKQEGTVID